MAATDGYVGDRTTCNSFCLAALLVPFNLSPLLLPFLPLKLVTRIVQSVLLLDLFGFLIPFRSVFSGESLPRFARSFGYDTEGFLFVLDFGGAGEVAAEEDEGVCGAGDFGFLWVEGGDGHVGMCVGGVIERRCGGKNIID